MEYHNLIGTVFPFLVVAADWHLKYPKSSPLSVSTSFVKMSLCNSPISQIYFPKPGKWVDLIFICSCRGHCWCPPIPLGPSCLRLPDFHEHLHSLLEAVFAYCDGLKYVQSLWHASLLSPWMWARFHGSSHFSQMEGWRDSVTFKRRL